MKTSELYAFPGYGITTRCVIDTLADTIYTFLLRRGDLWANRTEMSLIFRVEQALPSYRPLENDVSCQRLLAECTDGL